MGENPLNLLCNLYLTNTCLRQTDFEKLLALGRCLLSKSQLTLEGQYLVLKIAFNGRNQNPR